MGSRRPTSVASEIGRDIPSAVSAAREHWGSDAIAALLRAIDLPYLALNPGASYRGLHDSIVNYLGNERPQMLLCLHEESAVAIAHGYAKATGKMMGVVLHSNVGLMHGTMAIFNAWCDRMPMLILGATGPRRARPPAARGAARRARGPAPRSPPPAPPPPPKTPPRPGNKSNTSA